MTPELIAIVSALAGAGVGYRLGFEAGKAKVIGLLADYRAMRERGE